MLFFLIVSLLPPGRPVVAARDGQAQDGDTRPGVLLVGFRSQAAMQSQLPPSVSAGPGEEAGQLSKLNVARIEVPIGSEEQARQEWLDNPDVLFAELDGRVTVQFDPNDPRYPEQYGLPAVHAPQAWDVTTGSSSVILAVLDSGIDSGHPEFSGRLVAGYDFVEGDRTPNDACGHGTHVAGIAAATGNNRRGVAGVDWQARIMPVRVLDRTCEGWISDVVAGIVYAVDHGARVINLSLGTASSSTLLQSGTYYAYQQGVAVVAAGGNAGVSTLYYPARYPWVLAVGAVDAANNRAAFSNRSDRREDRMVVAPGVNVLSTTPRGAFYYELLFGTTRQYGTISGTSMATPFVSGAAALLASQSPFDTPDKIYQAITDTALDLGAAGYDSSFGYGLLQIDAALNFEDFTPPEPPPVVDADYDFASSTDCPTVTYNWIELRSTANRLPTVSGDGWTQVTLPFDFPFGGQTYNTLAVSANGYLTFVLPVSSGARTEAENFLIPGIAAPNQFIAPFWDDLNPGSGGLLYAADLGGGQFGIEWWSVPHQGYSLESSELTFEVILSADGEILFQYNTLRGPYADGASATIGLEFGNGTAGEQYSYNRAGAVREGQAIRFIPVTLGSTRISFGCLFSTSEQFRGCDQMLPWGVDVFEGLLPAGASTELSIRLLFRTFPVPTNILTLNQYAQFALDPSPPQPYSPRPLVCYQYSAADVLRAGGHVENLYLAVLNGQRSWQALSTVVQRTDSRLVSAVPRFGIFGVFARQPERLPVTGAPMSQATTTNTIPPQPPSSSSVFSVAIIFLTCAGLLALRKHKR